MSFKRLVEDIRENSRNRPGRIALVLSALSIGILALTVLACILKGLEQRGDQLVKELGANVVSVSLNNEQDNGFSPQDVEALTKGLGATTRISVHFEEKATLSDYDQEINLVATDHTFSAIKGWGLQSGHWLDRQNLLQSDPVCIIPASLAHELDLQLQQTLTIKDTPLTVIGILADDHGSKNTLFIPRTLQPLWSSERLQPDARIQTIFIQAQQRDWTDSLRRAENILHSNPNLRERLIWITPETLTRDINKLQTSLKWTAGSVALLCLLLGGATLMSLMTANVRERIPEIGLRLSLGAAPSDIYSLFLVEALVLTLLAALIGSIGGHLLILLGPLPLELPYVINLQTVILPSALCVILALLFSWGPASMAARINPADALRHE